MPRRRRIDPSPSVATHAAAQPADPAHPSQVSTDTARLGRVIYEIEAQNERTTTTRIAYDGKLEEFKAYC
jgi:hypothetical protein